MKPKSLVEAELILRSYRNALCGLLFVCDPQTRELLDTMVETLVQLLEAVKELNSRGKTRE